VAGNDLLLYEFGELAESELQLGSVVEVLAACLAHLPVIARTAHRSSIRHAQAQYAKVLVISPR